MKQEKFLNISDTDLDGHDIHSLLSQIDKRNQLRSINFSHNSVKQLGVSEKDPTYVIKTISSFIHYSDTLLHIDLGGLNLLHPQIVYLFKNGLRRSRTLLSCHFVGINVNNKKEYREFMDLLKAKTKQSIINPTINQAEYNEIFEKNKSKVELKELFADSI